MSQNDILVIQNVSKHFGGLKVLTDVNLNVFPGEIMGLIGPNGAGKSTIFNIATSFYRPDTGSVFLKGKNITGVASHKISRMGMARTFQLVKTFTSMTSVENVKVGAIFSGRLSSSAAQKEALAALELVGLGPKAFTQTAHLTLSDRRLLEIARAVATRASIALLDEPLAGLNPAETNHMLTIIDKVRNERGTAILWVEHKVSAIFSLCNRVAVLDAGRIIACDKPDVISCNQQVIEAYLGKKATGNK